VQEHGVRAPYASRQADFGRRYAEMIEQHELSAAAAPQQVEAGYRPQLPLEELRLPIPKSYTQQVKRT